MEIIINGRNTTRIAQVFRTEHDWEIAFNDLVELGLHFSGPVKERVLLSEISSAEVVYDSALQRLFLNVPSNMLPMQYFGANLPESGNSQPRRDTGAFINYNLVSITGNRDDHMASLWHELHFFNNDFFFISNGMYQNNKDNFSSSGYTRYESFYQHDNESDMQVVTLGDVINATPNWGRSIRIGGIRIARDYELNPTLVTYPLPQFYGESALPGSAELIINNQLRWSDQVTAGPFTINIAPYMSGVGVAQVVTTNAQGQQVRQAVNFYITNQLLAPKMFDYDITMGLRRDNFGLASNDYSNHPVISSSFRYGLNSHVTPQILLQAGEGLHLGGAGFTFLAGPLGVVDVASTSSYFDNANGVREYGRQASVAYNYTYQQLGINANYLRRYGQYRDLGTQDNNTLSGALHNTQMQVAFFIHDRTLGGFNLGYFQTADNLNNKRASANLSWSQYFAGDVTTFLSISRTLFARKENILSFTLSIPFGASSQASESAQHNSNGEWHSQIQAASNAPYSGGFGWGMSADDSTEKNLYISGDWRTKYSELSLSAYRGGDQTQYTTTLNGALAIMDNYIYPTHFITDSFAVVDTEQTNVPVMIGHQLIGNTDKHGKLLVPDLNSYLENRLAIDPMQLPANAIIDSIEQLVTPRRKGGIHVKFPISFSQSALVTVLTSDNQPLPAGALLMDRDSQKNYTAGWGGDVYFENLNEPIVLYWAEGECLIDIQPAIDKTAPLPRLGPVICQPVTREP